MDIPSVDVIRHWVAWGPACDCEQDDSVERVEQFNRWLTEVKAQAWADGAVAVHMYFDYKPNSTIPRNPYAKGKTE